MRLVRIITSSSFLVICCALLLSVAVLFERQQYQQPTKAWEEVREQQVDVNREKLLAGVAMLSGQQLLDRVREIHPIQRLECGSWVDSYSALHRKILHGDAPQRYAIMRSKKIFENGLADRLSSSVSILLYAILSGRAFQYDWEGDWPLWESLNSDHIDWRYTGVDIGNETQLFDHVCDKGIPEYKAFFGEQDPSRLGDGKHSVVWYSDHGIVWKAFENPLLMDKLRALGMQQDTAFACLFDFLYRPAPDVLHLMERELSPLLDPNILKVCPCTMHLCSIMRILSFM